MSNYYMMECYPRRGEAVISSYPDLDSPMDNWLGGTRWTQPIPQPLVFQISEDEKGVMRPLFSTHFLVMSDALVEALREIGVDNIDAYDAIFRETDSGQVHRGYKAVNVIGLVAAVDMAASEVVDLGGGDPNFAAFFFERIALDESKCRGLLFFRLAEKMSAIVVHKSVKEHLEKKGFSRLQFFAPEEWNAG